MKQPGLHLGNAFGLLLTVGLFIGLLSVVSGGLGTGISEAKASGTPTCTATDGMVGFSNIITGTGFGNKRHLTVQTYLTSDPSYGYSVALIADTSGSFIWSPPNLGEAGAWTVDVYGPGHDNELATCSFNVT